MMDGDTGANGDHRTQESGHRSAVIHHTVNTAATRAEESGDQISQVLSAGCHPAVSRHCHAEMVSCVTLCHGQWVVYLHTLCLSRPHTAILLIPL